MQICIMFITLFKNLYNYKYIINSSIYLGKIPFDNFFSTMTDNLLFNNIADILCAILSSVIGP